MKTRLSILALLLAILSCKHDQSIDASRDIATIENSLTNRILIKDSIPTTYSIEERMQFHNVPGLSITVIHDGKIHWSKSYGVANGNDEVSDQTIFQGGSISKAMTSLAVMTLVREGKLDLDEDINQYLKGWKIPESQFIESEKVTARRLLGHLGGINDDNISGYGQTDTLPSLIEILNGKGNGLAVEVDTVPGSIYRYTGGGYTILQKAIEDISGTTFEQYMAEEVFDALEMTSSTFQTILPGKQRSLASNGHGNTGEEIEGSWKLYPEQAAAGLWSTSTDIAKFCLEIQSAHLNRPSAILSKEDAIAMLTDNSYNYGLGIALEERNDTLIFKHDGINDGFQSRFVAFANRGEGLVIMTNSNRGLRLIREIQTAVSNYYNWNIPESKTVETVPLTAQELQKLAGKYKYFESVPGTGDYFMDMVYKNGRLSVTNSSEEESFRQTYTLTPLKGNKFIDLNSGLEISFVEQKDGEPLSFLWANRAKFNKVD